jgi:putative addiction module component (TIGR02574 family)
MTAMSRVPLDQILDLPASERVELAQQIWESVVDHPEGLALTPAQRDELERRWQALQQDPDEGEPWETVKAALHQARDPELVKSR